jgi:hypothetical protein
VLVDTFGEDNVEGYPARRLYESFGFVPGEYLPAGPAGGSRQRFRSGARDAAWVRSCTAARSGWLTGTV